MNKEEIKYLSEANQIIQNAEYHKVLKEIVANLLMSNDELQQENKQLKEKNYRAIEYIEEQQNYPYPTLLNEDTLLKILKGENDD